MSKTKHKRSKTSESVTKSKTNMMIDTSTEVLKEIEQNVPGQLMMNHENIAKNQQVQIVSLVFYLISRYRRRI